MHRFYLAPENWNPDALVLSALRRPFESGFDRAQRAVDVPLREPHTGEAAPEWTVVRRLTVGVEEPLGLEESALVREQTLDLLGQRGFLLFRAGLGKDGLTDTEAPRREKPL